MKTNKIKLTILILCLGAFSALKAQGLYNLATLDDDDEKTNSKGALFDPYYDKGVEWADSTIGGTVGVGWGDVEGNSELSYCLGAEYQYKVTGENVNPKGAGYLGAFANYSNLNGENVNQSAFRGGIGYTQFNRLTTFNEVQWMYGAKGYYETGKLDSFGFEEDITGFGIYLFTGVNIRICDKASIGLEVPVVSYLSRTFESDGNEFDQDQVWAGINKDNNVSVALRWHLGQSLKFGEKDTDGDGFDDKIDECPNVPGDDNGCPDSDGDGIIDKNDACPDDPGTEEYNGCPDSSDG